MKTTAILVLVNLAMIPAFHAEARTNELINSHRKVATHQAYDKWTNQFYRPDEFEDHWRDDLATFIKRDRNHPSVFIWSVGNEPVRHQHSAGKDYAVPMMRRLADFVRKLEPARQVTAALFPSRWSGARRNHPEFETSKPAAMTFHMDVMGVNYRAEFFEPVRRKYPQLTFIPSEASTGNPAEPFHAYDRSYAVGQFYRGGTENIGESFGWPSKDWISGPITLTNRFEPTVYAAARQTAGRPHAIRLATDGDPLKADGLDLAYIDVAVVDREGRVVPTADHSIRFTVQGAGTNTGVGNGDLTSDEPWQADHRSAYLGRCQLIIRAKREPGSVRMTAEPEGFEPATLNLQAR